MKATIIKANHTRSLYIFEREDSEIGYLEVLDLVDLETEEELAGGFQDIGNQIAVRLSTNERLKICIEDFCSLEVAEKMID